MAETVLKEAVVPVAQWGLKKLWQQLGYVFCFKSNIGDLNKKIQQLRDKREGVDLDVNPARDALKTIDPEVEHWLEDVDNIIKEKETTFNEQTVAAKAACCNGWLPNLKGRFSLGRKAKKMTLEVDQLRAKDFRTIAHSPSHPELEFPPTEDSTQLGTNFHDGARSSGTSNHEQPPASEGKNIDFVSRRSTIEAVMNALEGNQINSMKVPAPQERQTNFHEGASSSGASNHEPASEKKNIDFDSRKSTTEDVMEAQGGNRINPIIICGLGGIGKTTLMEQVHYRAKKKRLFDEYTKATFKESVDVIQIQGELAGYLGLQLEGNATDARASELRQRLSQGGKKVLVMLDNVWATTPRLLWDIGIPPSCQILVTSRQQDLFKDMATKKNFPIHGLSDRDAWSLFKKTAGSCIESDLEFRVVAEKILKKCGGLPIAISTVGTALKGESIAIWKNALRELEKANPKNVPGVIEHVYGPIKFSYQSLPSEEAKSCLLLCCVLEEKGNVPVEDLVRDGFGLELFEGIDSMVERRNFVETLVHTLKSRFLLLDSDEEECVRMHDVVRDGAVYIASEEFAKRIVVRDTAATVKLMDCPKDSDFEESGYCSSLGISGRCQLLLLRIINSLKPPPTIFNRMKHLKVLAIIGRSSSRVSLEALVPSLAVLRNIQTLRLEYCDFNCDISVIGKLRMLMILSLRGSDVKQLPETFKHLSDLRLLDLTDCEYLREIAPGVISSLTRLEELYMWNSFKDWVFEKLTSTESTMWISQLEESDPAEAMTWKQLNRLAVEEPATVAEYFRRRCYYWKIDYPIPDPLTRWANSMDWDTGLFQELLSLSRLTTLQVILPPVNILLTTALFSKLERFRISIGWLENIDDFDLKQQSGNYLRVYDLDPSVAMGSSITKLLEKASHVVLKLTQPQLVNVLDRVCFAKTKGLKFRECNDVEHLFNSSAIFPVLHSLEISDAERLKEIFHCKTTSEWGLLRNMIRHVQVLNVNDCSSLKGIIVKDRVVGDDDEEVINFQCLTELTLYHLPRFTGIISKGLEILPEDVVSPEQSDVPIQPLFDTKVHFPVLAELCVSSMNFKEIWNHQLSTESFCELKTLKVSEFHNLLHLVPAHMQNRLQKLEHIEASDCHSLKEIFESKRLIVDDETISESGDQGAQMNKMVSFKQSRQAFQSLTYMSISGCNNLRTLLSPSVARGLVKLQALDIRYCMGIVEIVAAAAESEETEDVNMFPQLCTLELVKLPHIRRFSQGKYNLKWPLAKCIRILDCRSMEEFCSGSLITSKTVSIEVEDAGKSVSQQLKDSRRKI